MSSALSVVFSQPTHRGGILQGSGSDAVRGLRWDEAMGDALSRGMVLILSFWWDDGGSMNGLDSGSSGPCSNKEGTPANIQKIHTDTSCYLQ